MLFNGAFLPARNNHAYRDVLEQPSAWRQFCCTSQGYFFFFLFNVSSFFFFLYLLRC